MDLPKMSQPESGRARKRPRSASEAPGGDREPLGPQASG